MAWSTCAGRADCSHRNGPAGRGCCHGYREASDARNVCNVGLGGTAAIENAEPPLARGRRPTASAIMRTAITQILQKSSGYPDGSEGASAAWPSGTTPATSWAQVPERRRCHHGAGGAEGQVSVPAAPEARSCDAAAPTRC